MERLDRKPSRSSKRTSLIAAVGSAVAAGVVTFLIMFLLLNLQSGTSGFIGAGVAIVVGGIVSAVSLPTPHRER